MNIIDTFPQIANCFADDIFNMEYWENYANAISPGLAAKCKEDAYAGPKRHLDRW